MPRVALACKMSAREFFSRRYGSQWRDMLRRFDLELEAVEQEHEAHSATIDALAEAFRVRGLAPEVYTARSYTTESLPGADLVVSVGGDGEMLDVARYLSSELVVGFRSHYRSAGALLSPECLTPDALAESWVSSSYEVQQWTRVQGLVDDGVRQRSALALNEIFVGDRYSVGTARYTLHHDGRTEKQRSSGVVVSTGAGSTGWYKNILVQSEGGGVSYAEPFARSRRELRFLVRDPIHGSSGLKLTRGTLEAGQPFWLKSTMNTDGVVSFDCSKSSYDNPRVFEFNRGARLTIQLAETPLRVMLPKI